MLSRLYIRCFYQRLEPDVLLQFVTQVSELSQLHLQLHHNQQATGETAAVIGAGLHQHVYVWTSYYFLLFIYYKCINCWMTGKA